MANTLRNKQIFALAIPATISGLAEPLISLTDLAIIGNIPKNAELSLAAVGVSGSILSALIWVFAQTKTAVSAVVSKAYGAKNMSSIESLVPSLIFTMGIAAILVSVCCFFGSKFMLNLFFELDSKTLQLADNYFVIRVLGFPVTILTFALFGLFRGIQNTSWAMIISLIGGGVNVMLDLVFVNGYGVEPMGVEGAAFASVIAQLVMLLLAVFYTLYKSKLQLKWKLQFNKELRNAMVLTMNYALRSISLNVALILANRVASSYGGADLAVHTVLFNLWLFTAFFLDGFANAANALAGKYLGAKDWKNLMLLRKKIVFFSVLTGVLLGVAFLIFQHPIANLFLEKESSKELFYLSIYMVVFIQPFNGLTFGMDGVFKGMGEAKYLRNLLFWTTFLVFVPVLFFTKWWLPNLIGIWLAFILWIIARGTFPWLKFKSVLISHQG